jgi:transposase-like protein
MQHYSEEFKRSIIQKSLLPGGPSLRSLALDNGLILTTVYGWKKKYANQSIMKNSKKWTAEKKLQAIIETSSLSENELGEYLRKNGLHSSDLEEWKQSFYSSQVSVGRPKLDPELAKSKTKEKELQKNLRRKDRALAEMTARVVLLKKTQLLFGDEEDDE